MKRSPHLRLLRGSVQFKSMSRVQIAALLKDDVGHYFLLAAAQLNRTSLKKAERDEDAQILPASQRRAFAVQKRLPTTAAFAEIAHSAVTLRSADLGRTSRGGIEGLFRERLLAEGIPLLMSPPIRRVPSLLVSRRKPDGVYPDPATGAAPVLYLEIKNVRRVSDDIQKRLYEVAEAALEMKLLYGSIKLEGFDLSSTKEVVERPAHYREQLRQRVVSALPVVVVLMLCPRSEAERYREGAQAFVDRLFFQEEIEECLAFITGVIRTHPR